ncbi:hypothetical protein NK6_4639 [Bradyrhizobium diazoefficiens]|uniref:Uncharacterized protein n=1 Tax=Bradyrhizobium diazoefficiens TaxID=1355477 RepID=A0A0E4FYH4_9BRAD|nr:hypothetical protein NK6_4639 [Bradyrhizobium diazoefficiens]
MQGRHFLVDRNTTNPTRLASAPELSPVRPCTALAQIYARNGPIWEPGRARRTWIWC